MPAAYPQPSGAASHRPPAFVISLDFELHWGVSERVNRSDHPYTENLYGAREAVVRLLKLFERRNIHATWATVGKLFAQGSVDLESFKPVERPAYQRGAVDTYLLRPGVSEDDDPLHFAPSLIEEIRLAFGQEIGCHTFAHYYCDELGQSVQEFLADLQAAQNIAARNGLRHRSLVFPRNQVPSGYLPAIEEAGLDVYRGNPAGGLARLPASNILLQTAVRALRLADSLVNLTGHHAVPWSRVIEGEVANVWGSRFLRPYSRRLRVLEPLRLRRVKAGLRSAAARGEIFHLWWHPHNFGINQDENFAALENILDQFERLQQRHGMKSMTMAEVADLARS